MSYQEKRCNNAETIRTLPIELVSDDGEITLRQYTLDDIEAVFTLIDMNRDHLSQHREDTAEKYPDIDTLRASITTPTNPQRLRFGIRNKENILVGAINLTPNANDPTEGEIGYWQGAAFQGKGYIGRAVETLTHYGFETLYYERIIGHVFKTNTPSIRVLSRAGFQETTTENGYITFTKENPKNSN